MSTPLPVILATLDLTSIGLVALAVVVVLVIFVLSRVRSLTPRREACFVEVVSDGFWIRWDPRRIPVDSRIEYRYTLQGVTTDGWFLVRPGVEEEFTSTGVEPSRVEVTTVSPPVDPNYSEWDYLSNQHANQGRGPVRTSDGVAPVVGGEAAVAREAGDFSSPGLPDAPAAAAGFSADSGGSAASFSASSDASSSGGSSGD